MEVFLLISCPAPLLNVQYFVSQLLQCEMGEGYSLGQKASGNAFQLALLVHIGILPLGLPFQVYIGCHSRRS